MDIKSLILIAGGLMIVAVILHGIWIAWRARRESLPMEIARDLIPEDFDEEARFRHELPNGGARILQDSDDSGRLRADGPPMLLDTASGRPGPVLDRDTVRREPARSERARLEAQRATNQDLFGDSDALITENRRPPTEAQREARKPAARTTSGGYASTSGSHAGGEAATPAIEQQTPANGARTTATEAPALRPRVQNVTVPANVPPVARRGVKERVAAPPSVVENESQEAVVDSDAVISIFLLARAGRTFSGHALYKALRARGLKYADMNIFHRVDPVSRVSLYSVANAVNPGTFDLSKLDELQTPGLVFFMQMEGLDHPLSTFDDMRRVASDLAKSLEGELKDENRSVVGTQTFDHYRERIAEYSRRRLSRRA